MADDPQNNDPVKQYGTPSEQFKQSGTGTPSIDPNTQKSLEALGDESAVLLTNMTKLVQMLSSAKTPIGDMGKEFDKWKNSLKYAVDATEDVSESLKEVLDINKKFSNKGIFDKRTYKDVHSRLEELFKAQKKLQGRGSLLSAEENKKLDQSLHHTAAALDKIKDAMKDVADANEEIDEKVFLEIAKNARMATAETTKLGASLGRGGKVSRGVQDIAKIMGSGMFDKFARAGGIAKELNKWKTEVQKEGKRGAGEKQRAFARKFGLKEDTPLDELAAFRRTSLGKARGAGGAAISGRTGFAGILDRVVERAAGGQGRFAGAARGLLEAGGGEVTGTGVGMRGLQGIAGMGEGVMGGIGEAAVPLAILDGIRKLYDTITEQNKDIFKHMGKGGLFAGGAAAGQSARDVFQAVKYNLAHGGMYGGGLGVSTLGVDAKQTQAVIDAMEDMGIALPELSQKLDENTMSGVITDRRARGFGGVQQLAYTTGKQLGLDTGETARENTKLLMQFGQSQETINKLFRQFVGDTKAAGITTTKYLSIIDDVTGNFDRMGKSLQSVTSIMRVLGSTGLATSDDLKEALKLLLGPQKTLEQTAFTLASVGRGGQAAIGEGLGREAAGMRVTTGAGLRGAGLDISDESLKSVDGVTEAMGTLAADTKIDVTTRQSLNKQLENLLNVLRLQGDFQKAATNKMNVVDLAANVNALKDAKTAAMVNWRTMQTQLKLSHKGVGDLFREGGGALLQQMGPAIGSPEDFQKTMPRLAMMFANAGTKALAESPQAFKGDELKEYFNAAVKAGLTTERPGMTEKDMQDTLQQLAKSQPGKMTNAIRDNSDLLTRLADGMSATEQVNAALNETFADKIPKSEELAQAMLTSEDVLTQAINRLTSILDNLYTMFSNSVFFSGKTPEQTAVEAGVATPAQQADYDNQNTRLNFWSDLFTGEFKKSGKEFWDLMTYTGAPGGAAAGAAAAGVTGVAGAAGTVPAPAASHVTTVNNYNQETTQTTPNQQAPINRAGESAQPQKVGR